MQHLLSVVQGKPSGAGHCVLWLTSIWLMYSIVIKTTETQITVLLQAMCNIHTIPQFNRYCFRFSLNNHMGTTGNELATPWGSWPPCWEPVVYVAKEQDLYFANPQCPDQLQLLNSISSSLALGQNLHCFQLVRYWASKTSHHSAFNTLHLTLWLPSGLTAAAMTLQSDHMPVVCLSGGRLMGDSCSRPQEAALCRCDSFVTAVSITTRATEKKDILSEN